jgi:hypothetical protein
MTPLTPPDESGSSGVTSGIPSQAGNTPPHPTWRPSEQWVWQRLSSGTIADLNARDGEAPLDPSDVTVWHESRTVSVAFLKTMLLQEPYRGALPHQGVRIVGARFEEALDLEGARLEHILWLNRTRFEREVQLSNLKSTDEVSLEGSYFAQSLTLSQVQTGAQLVLSGARCTGLLNMNGLQTQGGLFMGTRDSQTAQFAEVNLGDAKITGPLVLSGVRCTGPLNMHGLEVQGGLFMNAAAPDQTPQFADVNLRGAKIGSQLELQHASCAGFLDLGSLQVAGHVLMEDGEFNRISLIFARLGGGLYLVRSRVASLDLTGARIEGEFCLGESDCDRPQWAEGPQLVLRNATVGVLQCPPSLAAWPALDLSGFIYKQMGGLSFADRATAIAGRPPAWFFQWLGKDKTFTPQPYHQLASVLRSLGHAETADAVLYEGKERERRAAGWRTPKWWGMSLLKWTIGYGYGYRYFRSLIWALGITLIGATILGTTPAGHNFTLAEKLAFSFDLLLPIVELDKRHSLEAIAGWARYYFYLHEVLGYVLGGFIVAGLAGITKKDPTK